MATITSSGVGSGLNVNSLVSQLVAAERAPYDARITRAETRATTEFSALAQLKGAMATLQGALGGMGEAADFQARKVALGSTDFFEATATSAAAPGNYQVEVRQLATSAQLGSAGIAGGSAAHAGTGALTISLGTTSFTVTLEPDASTLADLRDAINASTHNPGVSASLITDINGTHLVLGSGLTGEVNALRVTAADGDGQLARFVHDPPNGSVMTELSVAQDAIVFVAGYEIRDPDNTIDGAIEGVELTLTKAEPGTLTSMGVSVDNAGIRGKAEQFVTAYNALNSQITRLRSYNAETRAAGPLLGDAMLRGIESQLRRMITDPVSGLDGTAYNTLASLGITSKLDGSLELDSAKFDAAIARDPGAAGRVFAAEGGVAKRLETFLEQKLATGAEMSARDDRLKARIKELSKQKEALELRMEQIEARYMKQFNSLDTLLTQMQSTSTYLAQQLANAARQG